jgi:hypothetical protein
LHGRVDRAPAGRGDGTAGHRDTVVDGRASGPRPAARARVFAFSWGLSGATKQKAWRYEAEGLVHGPLPRNRSKPLRCAVPIEGPISPLL